MFVLLFSFLFCFVGVKCQGGPPPPDDNNNDWCVALTSPIYVCSDDVSQSFISAEGVILTQFNETTSYLDGYVLFLQSPPEKVAIEIQLEKRANGRAELMMSYEIDDMCEERNDPDSMFTTYLGAFGIPECPFGAGQYSINKLVADTAGIPLSASHAGEYQATLVILERNGEDKKFLACLKLDLLIDLC